jgi:transcription elongation factor Elf1
MSLLSYVEFTCPYCMAPNDLAVDPVNDLEQRQIVDCQICCQPIELQVFEIAGEFSVEAHTDQA